MYVFVWLCGAGLGKGMSCRFPYTGMPSKAGEQLNNMLAFVQT